MKTTLQRISEIAGISTSSGIDSRSRRNARTIRGNMNGVEVSLVYQPAIDPEMEDTGEELVHKDFRVIHKGDDITDSLKPEVIDQLWGSIQGDYENNGDYWKQRGNIESKFGRMFDEQ